MIEFESIKPCKSDQKVANKLLLQPRPPVIGQEQFEPNIEDAAPSLLMQSQSEVRPPTLPPKPRIGSGVPTQRGPPPPVTPRRSSLSTNNHVTSSEETERCSKEIVDQRMLLGTSDSKIPNRSEEAVMVVSATDKCDTRNLVDNLTSPQPGKSIGSESSRGFEPEGSVDMSPSYSESGGSGSAATNNGTPPFVKWKEGLPFLLEDYEGTTLFKSYLDDQQLGHYLDFLITCRGFKLQIISKDFCTEDAKDGLQKSLQKRVYKKYISPKNANNRIECIDEATKSSIESKLVSPDVNIFDGAVNMVEHHLATKFYPNFLTSDLFVDHIRAFQLNEPDSRISAASSVSGSRPHPRDLHDDSGMEEDKGGFSSSKSSTVPILTMSDSLVGVGASSVDPQRLSSDSTTTCNSSVFNSTSFLPTVEEDRELRINPPTATPSKGAQVVNHQASHNIVSSHLNLDALSLSHPPPAASSRNIRMKANEMHPSVFGSVGSNSNNGNSSNAIMPDIRSASYAYHANSSTYNPVSRQDSELQSQSSGAVGGDTTDDNYSTFTDIQQQQQHLHLQEKAQKAREKKLHQRNQHKEFSRIEKASQLVREDPNNLLPGAKQPTKIDQSQLAERSPDEFANLLISKLMAVKKEREGKLMLQQKLNQVGDGDSSVASLGPYTTDQHKKRYHQQQLAVFGSRSHGDPLDAESDQSILDDHVSRIFNKGGTDTPPSDVSRNYGVSQHRMGANNTVNTTSMFDTSRRSLNASAMSGHSTLPGRNRNQGYPQYSHNQMSASMTQQQYQIHQQQQQQHQYRTGQYHAGSSNSMSGELAPVRPASGTSKSLIDMSGSGSHPQANVPMPPYSGQQPLSKVHSWLKNVPVGQQQGGYPASSAGASLVPAPSSDLSMSKTSPRSSGRYNTATRAKSQDRSASGYPMYNMSQSFSSGQYGQVDPGYLTSRLQQEQQQHQQRPVSSRGPMTSSTSMLGTGNTSMISANSDPTALTTVVYRFPQEKEGMPYRVKIPRNHLTLLDIKHAMPKKDSNFRFYFKTLVDGEACFEHETNENALVPMWEGSVVVQCRND